MIKNTCIAMAACLAAGTAIAGEGAPPAPPHPLVQSVSSLFSKMQALPLQLLPVRQPAFASARPSQQALPSEIGCCVDEDSQPSLRVASSGTGLRTDVAEKPLSLSAREQTVAPAPAPAPAPAEPARHWQLDPSDGSVKRALHRWSTSSGWQLVWELPVDFPVGAQAAFTGGFEEAVAAVAVSLQNSEMPMKAIFYRGNKVLRIVAKGVQ